MKTRANRYATGDYVEVDVIPISYEEFVKKPSKREKGNQTRPAQQIVNDRRTRKWMRMTIQGNFEPGDYYLTFSFAKSHIPAPDKVEDAKKYLKRFLDKCRERYKKVNITFKYVWVMEYELDEKGEYLTNVHFHVLMSAGVSRDDIEDCWSVGAGKNKKLLGYVHAKRLYQNIDTSLEDVAEYFGKQARAKKGKKLWDSSRNLSRPYRTKNDGMFTQRQLENMATSNDEGRPIIEKKYPKYNITRIHYKYTDYRGWHLYLRMWKKEKGG